MINIICSIIVIISSIITIYNFYKMEKTYDKIIKDKTELIRKLRSDSNGSN